MSRHRDMPARIRDRIQVAAHIIANAHSATARGWMGDFKEQYDMRERLEVAFYGGPGSNVGFYRRGGVRRGGQARVHVSNITPLGLLRDKRVRILNSGSVEIIDGVTIPLPNFHGLVDMQVDYQPDFRDAIRENDVRMLGFEQSLSTTLSFSEGSDAAQFKAGQEITASASASQEETKEREKSSEKGRAIVLPALAPPGVEAEFLATMSVQPKRIETTGSGDIDLRLEIGLRGGKYGRGKGGREMWSKHKGRYRRHVVFESYHGDFLPCIRGERRGGVDCAEHFFNHPAAPGLIELASAPLDMPFHHITPPYDGWITIEPRMSIIRVNPDINPDLYEIWQEDLDSANE